MITIILGEQNSQPVATKFYTVTHIILGTQ